MVFYILSVIYLLVMFLMYKKNDKKLSIITSIIYAVALLFCYNTVMVCINSLLNIKGSLLVFSIINFLVATILGIISFKRRECQKYSFNKKEFVIVMCFIIIIFLIGYFRFRGFTSISYESGDSAIHYRQALHFSEELSLLNLSNSKDLVYDNFRGAMPISYVNAGILINLFSSFKSYNVFFCYDIFCLILCSLLFFSTISKLVNSKKNYLYLFIMTLLYILAYPLNSFLFGFCYLGLGVMVANLLYLTLLEFNKRWDSDFIYKLVIMFIICFSLFFSYYLFVPCLYLAVGLYYIHLWKKKEISTKKMLLYGGITLVIPFVIGFLHFFLLPRTIMKVEPSIAVIIGSNGDSYQNFIPIFVFGIVNLIILHETIQKNNGKTLFDILNVIMYILMGYIGIFLVLYIFKVVSAYYLYKLFYLYWLFVVIIFIRKLVNYRKYVYILFGLILISSVYIFVYPDTKIAGILGKMDIYHYNTIAFNGQRIIYDKDEVALMEQSIKYKDICMQNDRFIIAGDTNKNIWYYSVTGMIPTLTPINGNSRNLYLIMNPSLDGWFKATSYECALYFYEDEEKNLDVDKYEVLYQNDKGAILKRKKS